MATVSCQDKSVLRFDVPHFGQRDGFHPGVDLRDAK
jgi:hypothetical protein